MFTTATEFLPGSSSLQLSVTCTLNSLPGLSLSTTFSSHEVQALLSYRLCSIIFLEGTDTFNFQTGGSLALKFKPLDANKSSRNNPELIRRRLNPPTTLQNTHNPDNRPGTDT